MRAEFSTNVVQGTGSTGVAPRLAKPCGDTQPSVKNSRGLECNYGFCHSGGQSSAGFQMRSGGWATRSAGSSCPARVLEASALDNSSTIFGMGSCFLVGGVFLFPSFHPCPYKQPETNANALKETRGHRPHRLSPWWPFWLAAGLSGRWFSSAWLEYFWRNLSLGLTSNFSFTSISRPYVILLTLISPPHKNHQLFFWSQLLWGVSHSAPFSPSSGLRISFPTCLVPFINKIRPFLPLCFSVSTFQAFNTNLFGYALRNI